MSADTAETQALVAALRRIAPRAAALLARGAGARALAGSVWRERAGARAAGLDAALDTVDHRLGGAAPPERDWADAWLQHVVGELRGAHRDVDAGALSALLESCADAAAALARARLDARMPLEARAGVLGRLARLGGALGEDAAEWRLPLVRLSALGALPDAVWGALGRAPAWAVVRALAEHTDTEAAYRRALATLAHHPGAWAVPHVRAAAQRVRRDRVGDADPGRLGPLLAQWRWGAADPPLALVSAWAETERRHLGDALWAAGVHHAGAVRRWPSAEAHADDVERLGPRIRRIVDAHFAQRAAAHVAHWLFASAWTDAERDAAMVRAHLALARMRTLWADDPDLAPRTPAAHALRLVAADARSLFPDDPEDTTTARLRPAWVLAWRVPCTSPERAIVAHHGVADASGALAMRAAFDVAVARPDAPMAHTYASDPPSPERRRRERAVLGLLACIAREWRI